MSPCGRTAPPLPRVDSRTGVVNAPAVVRLPTQMPFWLEYRAYVPVVSSATPRTRPVYGLVARRHVASWPSKYRSVPAKAGRAHVPPPKETKPRVLFVMVTAEATASAEAS